jgi:hypothetical protein
MDIDAIRSVQFVQEALESLEIRIIAPNGLTASDEYRARAELRQHLGEAIEIRLRVVQSIERNSNSGKFRKVVAHIRPPSSAKSQLVATSEHDESVS